MKSLAFSLMLLATLPGDLPAGGCVAQSSVVVQSSGLVVTPFAVPVAVPVAVVQTSGLLFRYSAGPIAAAAPCGECAAEQQADKIKALGTLSPAGQPGLALLVKHCARCHTGGHAEGKTRLFDLGPESQPVLSPEWQQHAQQAFEAILSEGMPKGGDLPPDEALAIIRWLRSSPGPESK